MLPKLFFTVWLFCWSAHACAYLDPVSGSFLVQSLIAIVAGALVAIKTYWTKLKAFFSARGSEPSLESKGADANEPNDGTK